MVGTNTTSPQKLFSQHSLSSSEPSILVQNSRGLLLLMGCLHTCLIPTASLEAWGRLASLARCKAGVCTMHLHMLKKGHCSVIAPTGQQHTLLDLALDYIWICRSLWRLWPIQQVIWLRHFASTVATLFVLPGSRPLFFLMGLWRSLI